MSTKTKWTTWLVAGIFAATVVSCISSNNGARNRRETADAQRAALEAAKPPEVREREAKAKAKAEADFQFAVIATKMVRAAMKDPDSFELVQAGLAVDGPLCLTYRGKNSFGAKDIERTVVLRSFKVGEWGRHCAGKTVDDLSRVKYAL